MILRNQLATSLGIVNEMIAGPRAHSGWVEARVVVRFTVVDYIFWVGGL